MRTRREKRRRIDVPLLPCPPEDAVPRKRPERKLPPKVKAERLHVAQAAVEYTDQDLEQRLSFCCFRCACSKQRKDSIQNYEHDAFVQSSEDTIWHRRCCHGVKHVTTDWEAPIDTAIAQFAFLAEQEAERGGEGEEVLVYVKKSEISNRYFVAKGQESQEYNEDGDADPVTMLNTNANYEENRVQFWNLQRQLTTEAKSPAVVLDLFAGVGTGIIWLKRLGIAMKKVIHCEHDKVATHVFQWNHNFKYNSSLEDDGIHYVYYRKFEKIFLRLEEFMAKHAPIDIILGGPPCVDYSPVNAYGQGTQGVSGQFMIQLGALVRSIMSHPLQKGRRVHFVAENTMMKPADISRVADAFQLGWEPVPLDAKDFSPCRRKRLFFSNIPLSLTDADYEVGVSASAMSCIEEGFQLAAHLVDNETTARAMCFMASVGRIDDDRMLVFKKTSDGIITRTLSASEREAMMGFPKGYVTLPVSQLFETLYPFVSQQREQECNWRKELDPMYRRFCGNYHKLNLPNHYRFEVTSLGVFLKMSPPPSSSEPSFFTAEQYAKHLIGNAYSVAMGPLLLRNLIPLFAERKYTNFDYKFQYETK